jgi:3-dehydroquinate synthase
MIDKVKVELGERSYEILIGRGVLSQLGDVCRAAACGDSVLLVSDRNVNRFYGEQCETLLSAVGCRVGREVIPARESSKSGRRLFKLYEAALANGMMRDDFMVALGGGVVGDLTGYAAATYMRGIRFVQIPTSLLAMVDSSVGGKTGINLPQGKNLIGAFHQPAAVLIDLDVLETLPKREYLSGLAEVIKYGVIVDPRFFEGLEHHVEELLARDSEYLRYVVRRCCEIKAEVVGFDEREKGLRAILNFGHTFGHALENCCGYGTLYHGEAVAIGMVYAARLSCDAASMRMDDVKRIECLLQRLGLPVSVPADLVWKDLLAAMCKDKKSRKDRPTFVLGKKIGEVIRGGEISEKQLRAVWKGMRGD